MSKVLTSRRFWTFVVDQVVTILMFIASTYIQDPAILELVKMVIILVNGIAGFLILAYTVEDVAIARASARALPPEQT